MGRMRSPVSRSDTLIYVRKMKVEKQGGKIIRESRLRKTSYPCEYRILGLRLRALRSRRIRSWWNEMITMCMWNERCFPSRFWRETRPGLTGRGFARLASAFNSESSVRYFLKNMCMNDFLWVCTSNILSYSRVCDTYFYPHFANANSMTNKASLYILPNIYMSWPLSDF